MKSKTKSNSKIGSIALIITSLLFYGFTTSVSLLINQLQNDNRISFSQAPSFSTPDDLYFSIGPTGQPQYGQNVSWNLWDGLSDQARFYHVKKGDFGFAAIDNNTIPIAYTGSEPYDVDNNLDVNMNSDWVKVETAWNFAPNTFNIIVISFTNQSSNDIESGVVQVHIPFGANLNFQELKVYNEWINTTYNVINNYTTQSRIYTFEYDDLEEDEIRHIYLYMSQGGNGIEEKRTLSQFDITAVMPGYGSDVLTSLVNPIPHDPNAMYLMNTYYQGAFNQCNHFLNYPEMYQQCLQENISWFGMQDTPCENKEYEEIQDVTWEQNYHEEKKNCFITDYPYCHVNTEDLYYRVTCFNDGEGIAKDVYIKSNFQVPPIEPFRPDDYLFLQTLNYPISNATSDFNYPQFKFDLTDINLPGLADPDVVRMYSECSSAINFRASTLCDINVAIVPKSNIVFTDLNDNAQAPIYTNQVVAVPYEPLNTWDYCASCKDKSKNKNTRTSEEQERTTIEIFTIDGQNIYAGVYSNPRESIDKLLSSLNLNSGMYIIRVGNQSNQRTSKYFFANP